MLALDSLSKFSETSVAAEVSAARWSHISTVSSIHSKQYIRRTQSDSSPVRYKELSKPTNEPSWWSETAENMALEPQPWTPSVRHETTRHEVEVIQQSASAVPDTSPRGFRSSPPAAPVTVLTRNSVANCAAGALRGPQRFVQRLLRELIASLPLLPSDANHAKIPETPIKMIRHASTARSQSSPPPRRSLSVQTHACEEFQDQSWRETRPAKHRLSKSFRKGEERWAGGVRALRDAHVRLVLRQLRHVERLNRALDRRTVARPPTL